MAAMERPPIEPIEPAFTFHYHSVEQLDRLTGHDVFTELYSQHAWDQAFPDPQLTLQKLGVDIDSGGMKLNDDAPWSKVRQGIMSAENHSGHLPPAGSSSGQ